MTAGKQAGGQACRSRRRRLTGASRSLALLPACPLAIFLAAARPDYPPVARTGGFGELTCAECHTGSPVNPEGTSLTIDSLPERWRPGEVYRIAIVLRREGLERGGFELAARFADSGAQAGTLSADDTRRTTTTPDTTTGVQYAHHTREGTRAEPVGRWVVVWRAPTSGRGAIAFNAAAVASNDDDSNLGDQVATASVRVASRR